MDDVPICPPWWPHFIWWWIHHPPPPPPNGNGPIKREELFEATQNVLVGLHAFHTANALEANGRPGVQESSVERMKQGVEQLQALVRG